MWVSPGKVDQEAEATGADHIEPEEITGARHPVAQMPDDCEQYQIKDEFVECRGLAEHPMLHNCPGEITEQTKGVTTKQVTETADSLGQREGQCEEITSWVVDMVPPFDQQHSQVATEESSRPGLAAVPQ